MTTEDDLCNYIREQIAFIGEDPTRPGLVDTPRRVIKALKELTVGYTLDPAEILKTRFDAEPSDEMIVVRGIPFSSLCEHHMLPFTGHVTVAYIPGDSGSVVGLSKLPRLVRCFALRLQMQERLTRQIAAAIENYLNPTGVGVIVQAVHACCALRGVKSENQMITSDLRGKFRTDPSVRAEFLDLRK